MDRSTQIIALLAMLCFGLTASAQHGKRHHQKGIQAYPVYYLQGLGFEQDSSVIGLYGWIMPEDRMAVLQEESAVVALVMDTLISLPDMDFIPIIEIDSLLIEDKNIIADSALIYKQMSLDSIYYWDDYYDFDPDWDGLDSAEFTSRDELTLDSMEYSNTAIDSISIDTVPSVSQGNDSIIYSPEQTTALDSISGSLDSLEVNTLLPDSIEVAAEIVVDTMIAQVPEVLADTVAPMLENVELDSLTAPIPIETETLPIDTNSIKLGSSQGAILLKSDQQLLGNYSLDRPHLDSSTNRRTIFDRSREVTQIVEKKTVESRVDTVVIVQRIIEQSPAVVTERIIEQSPAAVTERVTEKQAEYSGEYAGLSPSERERQLRLDADSRRKAEAAQINMQQEKHDAALDADDRVQKARAAQAKAEAALAAALAAQVIEKGAKSETGDTADSPNAASENNQSAVKTPQATVVVQRDAETEKVITQLAARIDEQAAKTEKLRAADNQKIEGRFDRIETKMDTLLNALGKKVVLNEAVYSIPQEEMNIYFAINSHSISARSLVDLESYLSQLKNMTDYRIVLSGFADSSGNLEYNKLLVSKRITSVKEALLSLGISPAELLVNNYGKQKANAAKTYNQLDRKVAIQIFSAE